eukprot:2355412-Alexandrium_andersonii.AAC.1
MSASLVGSEMCIRDRPSAGAGGDVRCPSQHGGRRSRAREIWRRERPPGCLLYTSDAAAICSV